MSNHIKKFPPAKAGQALLLKEGWPQAGVVDSLFALVNNHEPL